MEERTGFHLDRLRSGEWVLGVAGVALLVDLLALPWYSLTGTFRATSAQLGAPISATGAQAHHLLGPFAILCALVGLAAWGVQATVRGPALALCVTVLSSALDVILVLALLVRVVFDPPTVLVRGAPGVDTIRTDVPAVVALFLAAAMLAGSWLSLRTDGIAAADAPQRIETLAITERSA